MSLLKSPLNYLGNKSKILSQILPLFPKDINYFYDVFCGGLDVCLNVSAKEIIANDKHEDLIWLLKSIQNYPTDDLGDILLKMDRSIFPMNETDGKAPNTFSRIGNKEKWRSIMKGKREAFYLLREKFNKKETDDFKVILLLMKNNIGTIEFRVLNRYCTFTCGSDRVNDNVVKTLNAFPKDIKYINLRNDDFRFVKDLEFGKNDFLYFDPPYLGTTQYKIRWDKKDECDLYETLDLLNKKSVRFALSNFEDGKNHTNEYLKEWCKNYHIHYLSGGHENLKNKRDYAPRQEILVTNY